MVKEKTQLEIIMERQDKFGRSCDPNYRSIKEQEEDEEGENIMISWNEKEMNDRLILKEFGMILKRKDPKAIRKATERIYMAQVIHKDFCRIVMDLVMEEKRNVDD